jgi:hypothetical protein
VPLTALVVVLFGTVVVLGYRRKRLTLSGMALGLTASLLSIAGSGLAVFLVWRAIGLLQPEYREMTYGATYNSSLFLFAFVALTLAITSSLYLWFGRKRSVLDLWVGALLWWLVLLLLTTFGLPGGSYLFTWPLLFSLLSLLILFIWNPAETRSGKQLALLLAGTIPAVILFVPIIQTVFVGLTVTSSALVMGAVALLLGLLSPDLNLISSMNRWLLPAASTVICLVFLTGAILTSHFDGNHPKQENVFYALQADTGQAVWASSTNRGNVASPFFSAHATIVDLPNFFPGRSWHFLTSQAPAAELAAPTIEVLSDDPGSSGRTLRLRVTSRRQAPVISLYVEADADVHATDVNGKVINWETSGARPATGNSWALRYYALPENGIELTLVSQSRQPIRIKAIDQSYELPFSSSPAFRPGPANIIPAPLPLSDATLVSKSFTF